MKNSRKKTRIMILVILVLAISIGFAALSTTLKINGNAIVKGGNWNVYWDNVVVNPNSVYSSTPEISNDEGELPKTRVNWSVLFEEPGDFYEFTVDAVNAGSVDAIITDIESSVTPELPSYINYSVTYDDGSAISVNDPLDKADDSTNPSTPTRKKYKVRIEFDSNLDEEELLKQDEDIVWYEFEYDVTYGQKSVNDMTTPKVISLKTDDGTPIISLGSEEIKEKYGSDVSGFNTIYPIDWQFFYSDEDYVYLITKGYVSHKYLPSELYKNAVNNYNVGFASSDYSINNIFTNPKWSSGMASDAIKNNPLTDKYLKWANTYPTANNYNAIATAYMMDTSVWANFAGNAKGAFAMGGPTIELLIESYNAKNVWKYETYDEIIPGTNATEIGYYKKRVNERSSTDTWSVGTYLSNGMFYPYYSETPNMWDISERSSPIYGYVGSYFIASPSAYNDHTVPILGYGGELYFDYSMTIPISNSGMRPVVAIPKSSLK